MTLQPSIERLTPPHGHPFVVGITPGESPLVPRTAAAWAEAIQGGSLYFAYVDPTRVTTAEHADGTVDHIATASDAEDDAWMDRERTIKAEIAESLSGIDVTWEFRYLAGETPRALTHLARAVEASAIVVGTRDHNLLESIRDAIYGSVAHALTVHQHRPVLVVPRSVVDWKVDA